MESITEGIKKRAYVTLEKQYPTFNNGSRGGGMEIGRYKEMQVKMKNPFLNVRRPLLGGVRRKDSLGGSKADSEGTGAEGLRNSSSGLL